MKEFKSIKNLGFNILGDGINDDTLGIQQAIDFCGQNNFDVYIPEGTYIIGGEGVVNEFTDECIKVKYNGMKIKGDGERTILKVKDNTPLMYMFFIGAKNPDTEQIKDVEIYNLKFDGNKQNQSGLYRTYNLTVQVSNTINEPTNIKIHDITSVNCYSGILPTEGGGISLIVRDMACDGRIQPNNNIEIYNCICSENGGWGIGTNWSRGSHIHDNITKNNSTMGITIWNSQDCVVENNISEYNVDFDINIEGVESSRVLNNHTKGRGGIRMHNSIGMVIDGNKIDFIGDWYLRSGIGVSSGIGYDVMGVMQFKRRPCENITVSNNEIISTGTDGYCVRVYNEIDGIEYKENSNIFIKNNTIRATKTNNCLQANGKNILIEDNLLQGDLYLNGSIYYQNGIKPKKGCLAKFLQFFK